MVAPNPELVFRSFPGRRDDGIGHDVLSNASRRSVATFATIV